MRRKSKAEGRAANGLTRCSIFADDGLEQAGDLRPGLDLRPLAVALFGEVDDLRFQLQDPLVGRVVVGDVLVLAAGPLGRRRFAVRPRHVLMHAARGDVRHERAADAELRGDFGLLDALGDRRLDPRDLLTGQSHGVSFV